MVTTTGGNNDDCPPQNQNTEPKVRKDRKRETDRLAQREHRRRQKLYVDELEAQLRMLKQESMTNQVGTLLEENERLRHELKNLRTFFSTIETLVWGHNKTPTDNVEAQAIRTPSSLPKENENDALMTMEVCDTRQDLDGEHFDSGVEMTVSHSLVAEDPRNTEINGHSKSMQIIEGHAVQGQEFYPQTHAVNAPSSATTDGPNFGGNATRDFWGLVSNDPQQADSMDYMNSGMPLWIDNFFAIGSLSPSDQLYDLGNPLAPDTFSDHQETANVLVPVPQYPQATALDVGTNIPGECVLENADVGTSINQDILLETIPQHETATIKSQNSYKSHWLSGSSQAKIQVQRHRSLSHVLMPPLPQDMYVHKIIEKARSNTLSRRMLLDAPTLADFLVDNPTNVLSADLKKYLEPVRRSRRTAEYLGTYWVSYLLLRWQVNQSAESYERIPVWFRPTDLQMHVAHPIAVDFIAWPLLRDEVVKLSQSEPEKIHEVMTTIGVYLDLDLESTLAKSLADEEVLNSAVCDLRNWKLSEGFFEIYPQWKGMCDSPSMDPVLCS